MTLRFTGIVIYLSNSHNNKKMYTLTSLFLGRVHVYLLKYKKNK